MPPALWLFFFGNTPIGPVRRVRIGKRLLVEKDRT